MQPLSVVVYHNDPRIAQNLAAGLSQHFDSVCLANSHQEVGPVIVRRRAEALVLDLELSGPDEVERFHHDFPRLYIVGTHRLADDKLWAEAMSLGASDICEPRDEQVLHSLLNKRAQNVAA